VGAFPKAQIPPSKIDYWPIKIVVGGLVSGQQYWKKPQIKFYFGGRQQCVVNDRDHLNESS
jgi:hypothetical protein